MLTILVRKTRNGYHDLTESKIKPRMHPRRRVTTMSLALVQVYSRMAHIEA